MNKKIILAVVIVVIIIFGAYFYSKNPGFNVGYTPNSNHVVEGCTGIPYTGKEKLKDSQYRDLRGGATCIFEIAPSSFYTLHLIGDVDANKINSIVVETEGKATQTLQLMMREEIYGGEEYIKTEDINFDGYKDLFITDSSGATGNMSYSFYLFNATTKTFSYSSAFSNVIGNHSLDLQNKLIQSGGNAGCAGECFIRDTYAIENGLPLLVKEVTQEWGDQNFSYFIRKTSERKNGKMELIKTERVNPTEGPL